MGTKDTLRVPVLPYINMREILLRGGLPFGHHRETDKPQVAPWMFIRHVNVMMAGFVTSRLVIF